MVVQPCRHVMPAKYERCEPNQRVCLMPHSSIRLVGVKKDVGAWECSWPALCSTS